LKFLKKLIKVLAITLAALVVLVYGGVFLGHHVIFPMHSSDVATIDSVRNEQFLLGPDAHPDKPTTMEEFIPVLAEQLARYNEIAEDLWPGLVFTNQSIIVEDIRGNDFYLIDPSGAVTEISRKEALDLGALRQAYVNGFSAFDGGFYLAVAEEDIGNYLNWQQCLHFGMYDAFMFFTHEGFHMREQSRWAVMDNIPNREREEYLENIEARTARYLMQRQLLDAIAQPDDPALILDALATYEFWKESFPEDYQSSRYFDRIEGTAYYFELLTGLYTSYPDQVKNEEDLQQAMALLATRDDVYTDHGVVSEGYYVGAYAAILLDRLGVDWKQELVDSGDTSPIELLSQHFEDQALPAPRSMTQQDIDEVAAQINTVDPLSNRGTPLVFRFLYDNLWWFIGF